MGKNQIGFHESDTNPLLLKHIEQLGLNKGDRVFIPLCGKTPDIAWLFSKGYKVAGAELSEIAIKQLFEELGVTPEISQTGQFTSYMKTVCSQTLVRLPIFYNLEQNDVMHIVDSTKQFFE